MMLARRLDWAAQLRRVFGELVTQCPRCGDHLRVLAFITDLQVSGHILEHLGLSSDRVPIAPEFAPRTGHHRADWESVPFALF